MASPAAHFLFFLFASTLTFSKIIYRIGLLFYFTSYLKLPLSSTKKRSCGQQVHILHLPTTHPFCLLPTTTILPLNNLPTPPPSPDYPSAPLLVTCISGCYCNVGNFNHFCLFSSFHLAARPPVRQG